MVLAASTRRESTSGAPPRPAGRARTAPQARLDRLRAGGNRAFARLVTQSGHARPLARCAGACECGGGCHEHEEAAEEPLPRLARRPLPRASVARSEDTRRATPPSPTPTPPTGATAPSGAPTCGPDVTKALLDVLAKTSSLYASWDSKQRDRACTALDSWACAGSAWDVVELHNRGWLDAMAPCADKAGPCKNTVRVDGQCSYAGSVNYAIFGAMCRLCDISSWWMEDLIWAYKGDHPLGQSASPNYGPSLEWARAGFRGWPAVPSPRGDRPGCTGSCPTPYTGPPFRVHWYPESPTESVTKDCENWAASYPPEFYPGDFGL
jgi:hypothetical protein